MSDSKATLTLDTLGQLQNGRVGATVEKHLERILQDCLDRWYIDKPRKLTLELSLTPLPGGELGLEAVEAGCKVTYKLPPVETNPQECPIKISTDDAGIHIEVKLPEQRSLFDDAA